MQPSSDVVVRGPAMSEETVLGLALGRATLGDQDAFRVFYDATAVRAYALAARVLLDHAQAEEVVQEAYLHLWVNSARFDPARGNAVSWILMIVHGKAVSRVRSGQARTGREATYHLRDASARVVASDVTYEEVSAAADAHLVHSALSTLTAKQREAVELAFFGGYTHTEVAGLLGAPLGTVKTRIRSGVQRMREVLDATGSHARFPPSALSCAPAGQR